MKKGSTTRFRLDLKKPPKTEWRAFDAMSDDERHQAALSDPDSPPATEAQLARTRRVPAASARRLAHLGGSEPALRVPPRRRQKVE
jgi:putative transcriptional regulator